MACSAEKYFEKSWGKVAGNIGIVILMFLA